VGGRKKAREGVKNVVTHRKTGTCRFEMEGERKEKKKV